MSLRDPDALADVDVDDGELARLRAAEAEAKQTADDRT